MQTNKRIDAIEKALKSTFAEAEMTVVDESALHIGHQGHGGAGHFHLTIADNDLAAMTKMTAHRAVYQALAHLMGSEIHALSIKIVHKA